MGWNIVRHSFVLLFNNLGNALRVSVGPYLIGLAVVWFAIIAMGVGVQDLVDVMARTTAETNLGIPSGELAAAILIALVVLMFVSSWVAVGWHRYVLLEEYPGLLPGLAGRPVGAYLGRMILLTVVLVLCAIPISIVVGLLMSPFLIAGSSAFAGVFGALVGVAMAAVFSWLWLRLGLILPAIALGKPMTLRMSWSATAPVSGAILVATLIVMAINFAVSLLLGPVFGGGAPGVVLSLIVDWISIMVGISMLTTIYGHIVEGREIT